MRACSVVLSAAILSAAGCASDGAGASPLSGERYIAAMGEICVDTDARLAALPEPPEAISAADWAAEVALALAAEAERAEELVVDQSIGSNHRTFVTTTNDIAASYRILSTTVVDDPEGVGVLTTEITEFSLGRDDVAAELGLTECVRSTS